MQILKLFLRNLKSALNVLYRRKVIQMEKVDRTIDAICDRIQEEMKEPLALQEGNKLPEIIKALADLISARAATIERGIKD